MSTLSISNIVSNAWEHFKTHSLNISLAFISYIILSILVSVIEFMGELTGKPMIALLTTIFCGLMNIIFALGFAKFILDIVRNEKVRIETLFSQYKPMLILNYVIATIISVVLTCVGFLILIIPGVYIAIRLQYVTLNLIEQEKPNFIEAIKSSWNMTRGNMLDLLALSLISIFIMITGVLALVVGIFIAAPLVTLISTIAYKTLEDNYNPEEIY